ncbi:transposase [Peptoclostridium litorale DSM 5388]|uniref:Transposase IS66 n=5 Tax=Peptoclostridium litorale TaxID=1557 RepID=A0A069RGP2_PEPLI|nr:transposase IS66 [Peptoclostridium litorale DSM 5388]SIO38256.1 transposase [Peptoclostridium litorale DSM 5388]
MKTCSWYNKGMENTAENKGLQQNRESVDDLKNENAKLQHELEMANAKIKWYEEQLRLSAAKKYGTSSDNVDEAQISFFNEAEITARPEKEEPKLEEITYERSKKRGTNKPSFDDLPVERIEYEIPENEQVCEKCSSSMHEMSVEVRKELKIIPAKVCIVEHVRKVYACRKCQNSGQNTPVITAPMPEPVISGSFASPSLVAYLMYQKYSAALPLTRQEKIFSDFRIEISKQNMSNWIIKACELWLDPFFERLKEELLKETFIQADESPLKVLTKDGKPAGSKSYMWLYKSGAFGKKISLYEYQQSRSGKHPKNFLNGFSGFLQTDDYSGYNSVENVTRVGCFAHARRYYTDALKALPKESEIESTHAHKALEYFKRMFRFESEWKDLSANERFKMRNKNLKPAMEAYLSWLQEVQPKIVRKSKLGQAVNYSLSNWELLSNVLKDGQCELTNNAAERQIKPFVIGRKNYLFCKSPHGAKASAMAYSIIETAKMNGLNPFYYLKYLFEQLPNTKLSTPYALDHLLPWSETLPKECLKTFESKK